MSVLRASESHSVSEPDLTRGFPGNFLKPSLPACALFIPHVYFLYGLFRNSSVWVSRSPRPIRANSTDVGWARGQNRPALLPLPTGCHCRAGFLFGGQPGKVSIHGLCTQPSLPKGHPRGKAGPPQPSPLRVSLADMFNMSMEVKDTSSDS